MEVNPNGKDKAAKSSKADVMGIIRAVGTGIGSGIFFGIAFEKSKVLWPHIIRSQMNFSSFIMLKMFLGATACGTLAIAVMEGLGQGKRSPKGFVDFVTKYGGTIAGGTMLGIGMGVSGSCPGTVYAQIGAGIENAPITLAGCFSGAILYSIMHALFQKPLNMKDRLSKNKSFDQHFEVGMPVLSIIFSAILAGVLILVENYLPWQQDLINMLGEDHIATSWSPIVAGIVLGLLQIPSMGLMSETLGTSSTYVTIPSYITKTISPALYEKIPYFHGYSNKLSNLWQVALVGGIIGGSFLSKTLSAAPAVTVAAASNAFYSNPLLSYVGGVLLVFGARLGGGCTSGHGISGMGQLGVASFVGVICMFAGAIPTTLLLDKYFANQ